MELIDTFDKRANYTTKFEDINSVYKEGIEIITEEIDPLAKLAGSLIESPDSEENQFSIKGPYGLGVTMDKCKEGTFVCISYGVTITLFIDLVTYILRRNIYRAGKMLKKPYKIFANENLDKLDGETYKLVLISLYDSQESMLGSELCKAADRITKEFMFGNFEYFQKVGQDIEDVETLYKEKIDQAVTRVVCAVPTKLAGTVRKVVAQAGIKQNKVIYL
eukprot:TRINITY_DN73128_c0_g1_i1.p2 TRINITY_DN73128_c0_g1~~TRINITY_DN73128_c0_g1_i1.p2  ORF type:complete len:220 (+),score=31.60 TRINITY_DN73128_c0_g1_i1:712-1371(+)